MGYDYYANGELACSPALDDELLSELAMNASGMEEGFDDLLFAEQKGEDDTVGIVDGEITVIPGARYTSVTTHETDFGGDLDATVAKFVEVVKNKTTVNGTFDIDGEQNRDISRVRVENNVVHCERPKLLWPNGDQEDL